MQAPVASAPAPSRSAARDQFGREVEFIARLFAPPGPGASDADRQAWMESPVADLLYPSGHPCAGLPLDSVSAEDLAAAASQPLESEGGPFNSLPEIDRPQCHLQGRWPFFALNQAYGDVDREDPESVVQFLDRLAAMPQDPKAYPADIWLPCEGHPDATTMRAYFQGLVRETANQIMAGPRCNAS